MTEWESRIASLRLAAHRREMMDPWMRKLALATRGHCSAQGFLSLQETNSLKTALHEKLRDQAHLYRENWAVEDSRHLFGYLERIGEASSDITVCLFSNVDSILGAVQVSSRSVLRHAKEVWNLVGEDLVIVSRDLSDGLYLGLEFYDIHGTPAPGGVFEISGWGNFGLGRAADRADDDEAGR